MKETPARFQGCVAEIAQQIAGVVAAIQANDITRQQMEHVRGGAGRDRRGDLETGGGAGEVAAGLTIQSYQVRSIETTVEGWTGQIRRCLERIAQLAVAEILEMGRGVLGRERLLEAELRRIEQLEEQCAADNARVQSSLSGMAGLMQLVSEHLERSRAVRERLQLLMFNSIVEAEPSGHAGGRDPGDLKHHQTPLRGVERDHAAVGGGDAGDSPSGRAESGDHGRVFRGGAGGSARGAGTNAYRSGDAAGSGPLCGNPGTANPGRSRGDAGPGGRGAGRRATGWSGACRS